MSSLGRIQVGGAGLSAGAIDNIARAMFEMYNEMEKMRQDEYEAQSQGGIIGAKAAIASGTSQATSERTKAYGQIASGSTGTFASVASMIGSGLSYSKEKTAISQQEQAETINDALTKAANENAHDVASANGRGNATQGEIDNFSDFTKDMIKEIKKGNTGRYLEKGEDGKFKLTDEAENILGSIDGENRTRTLNELNEHAREAYKSFRKDVQNFQNEKNQRLQAFTSIAQTLGSIGSGSAQVNASGDMILAAIAQGVKENAQTAQQMAHSAQDATSSSAQNTNATIDNLRQVYGQLAATQRN